MAEHWEDRELLEALALRDGGISCGRIARFLGRSRSSVLGMLRRIDRATEPSRHDGTLAPGWWRPGIAARCRKH